MRTTATCAALAALALLTACGDDGDDAAAPAPETSSSSAPASSAPAGGGTTLTGTVGTADDPNAFVISLTDASGEAVTTLPAGEYEIEVSDLSAIHNFHLTGTGVDETTTVPEITDTTFTVTLEPGSYKFVCDPHPRMVGEFTVT